MIIIDFEIIEKIPEILVYFLPGYIGITIFNYLRSRKLSTSETTILSCAISFIVYSLVNIVCGNCDTWLKTIISFISITIFSLIFALIHKSKWFSNILINKYEKSPYEDLWNNLLKHKSNGMNLSLYLKNKNIMYYGHYKMSGETTDNDWITLSGYVLYHTENNEIKQDKIINFNNDSSKFICVRLSDIDRIEVD